MSTLAIKVENLSKQYKIGVAKDRHDTLRDALTSAMYSPFRAVASLLDGRRSSVVGRLSSVTGRDSTIWALKDVSFEVKVGEIVGIIGRNGAGKSTLLKILSRVTEPTDGKAEIYGRVGSLLEVGIGFHGELTGRENIYLNGAILGMKKAEIERKFDEIVAFAEIEKFIDTPVKRYSSGMYVRLAFAVAAHLEPDILIVDEVLAVGDIAFQRKCLGKMQDVAGYGRTVLFVSHNMGAIKTLCDRCLFIDQGKKVADGPSDSMIEAYINQSAPQTLHRQTQRIEAHRGKGFFLHHKENCGEITVFCGDPIIIEFDIEAPNPIAETNAGIGITIVSETGDPIVSMSSNVQRALIASGLSRFWKVRCDMGRLPLNAGTYFAKVYVGNDEWSGARFDNAMTIRVMEYDVFGWGKSLPSPSQWGPMYWAPEWNIRPVE